MPKIDPTGSLVEVTSYVMRMAALPRDPKGRADGATGIYHDLHDLDHDHLTVLMVGTLMMQVGMLDLLAERLGLPGFDTERLVSMMAQQALANHVR